MCSGKAQPQSSDTNIDKSVVAENAELSPEELAPEREQWDNQCEFFLSCLGYAVGFGNVWRFPYLCYKNGGAVFLIPYVIMLFCAGIPLFFLELTLGQYVGLGPNILFPKIAPLFSGLGWGMLILSGLVAIYYNVILAWTLFYTFASMQSTLPWSHCNHTYSAEGCFTSEANNICNETGTVYYNQSCVAPELLCSKYNATLSNFTHCETVDENGEESIVPLDKLASRISSSENYFKNGMLGVTGTTWEDMGGMRWELVGCLALAWIIVGLCLIRGVKSSGKVVYFTALFPYAVLIILFIRGITLEGAYQGVEFYFLKPNITKLGETEVWNDAATQIFYSLGSSFGGLITLASYNKFKNNCMRDAFVIALCNCSTSVFAGFVIFSILGFMANNLNKDIADVVSSGSGLAFVAYPEAVSRMPLSPLWAILFFTMLITLGLDSQFTMVETLTTAVFDTFESLRPKKPIVVMSMCFVLFLCGLTMCLDGGIYMFELFNYYSAGISVVILALFEIIAVIFVYGFKNFMRNIQQGIGIYMPKIIFGYWAVAWLVITPLSLLIILGFSISRWTPAQFGDYVYPSNIQGLGWVICAFSIVTVLIFAVYEIYKNRTNREPWRKLLETSEDFCPASERRLRELKGAAFKGMPEGIYRHMHDNEAFSESPVTIYPRIGTLESSTNSGYIHERETGVNSYGVSDQPPQYSSNHI